MAQAAANLMSTATTTEAANRDTCKVASTRSTTASMRSMRLRIAVDEPVSGWQCGFDSTLPQVYSNNWLTSSNQTTTPIRFCERACTSLNTVMPNPGGGTSDAGDTPQEVAVPCRRRGRGSGRVEISLLAGHRIHALIGKIPVQRAHRYNVVHHRQDHGMAVSPCFLPSISQFPTDGSFSSSILRD